MPTDCAHVLSAFLTILFTSYTVHCQDDDDDDDDDALLSI